MISDGWGTTLKDLRLRIYFLKPWCKSYVLYFASDNSDIELRITEKMGFNPVEISVRIKQNEKADKSRRAVNKTLTGQLSFAGNL